MPDTYVYDAARARETERTYQSPEIVRQRVAIVEALDPKVGERVIDVGCGPGLLLQEMSLAVTGAGRVVGVDSSEAMLELARQRCAGLDHVRIERGDAARIDQPDGGFDAATCVQVLLYVPDVAAAIAELHRLLRTGGRLVIMETDWRGTVLNNSDESLTRRIIGAWDRDVPSPNLPARIGPMLERQGFDAVRVQALPIVTNRYNPEGFSVKMLEQFAECANRHGIAGPSETAPWLAALKRLDEEKAYFFCVNRFLFSAVKA